jgi:GNAT superfamily N-acetyltransferase
MGERVSVVEAHGGKAYRDFLEAPYIIQKKNECWVPPLRIQQKELFDEKKNPWLGRNEIRKFVAYRDGRIVGRIAAIRDVAHNETHDANDGHWGHFECIDDPDVARELFSAVEAVCAREWSFDRLEGPFNPHINEDVGLLIDGFNEPPQIMMPYNPPYYQKLVEGVGHEKTMDLYTYIVHEEDMTDKLKRGAEAIRKRSKLNYRKMNMKEFWEDAAKVLTVYRKAWEKNWNAVPMTDDEFHHLAKNMKSVVDPNQVFFAEEPETGELVGFSLALPNINEALIHVRDGRLFPFGLPKILWHSRKGAIGSCRIIIMGVLEEYRGRGIDAVFYADHFREGPAAGYKKGEMGWILETNTMMNRAAEMMGGVRNKTYRVYAKPLS